jgi:hypothetical protein
MATWWPGVAGSMRSTAELTSGKVAPMSVDCGSSNSAERSHWLAHTTVPGLHVAGRSVA